MDPNCYWLRKKKGLRSSKGERCVEALTNEECKAFTKRKKAKRSCKKHKCKWNEEDQTCTTRGVQKDILHEGDIEDELEDNDKDLGAAFEIVDRGGFNIFDPDFLSLWLGANANRVKTEFDEMDTVVCSNDLVLNVECIAREHDTKTIRLIVDGETNLVQEVVNGEIFNEGFIERLEGIEGRIAKREIDSRYILLCSSVAFSKEEDTQCHLRNVDEKRVRLMVDSNQLVEQIVFG